MCVIVLTCGMRDGSVSLRIAGVSIEIAVISHVPNRPCSVYSDHHRHSRGICIAPVPIRDTHCPQEGVWQKQLKKKYQQRRPAFP